MMHFGHFFELSKQLTALHRDGNPAECVLFYSYRDKSSIDWMIDRGEGSWQQKERQRYNLRQVIGFCENKTDCRRQQVLAYFGEQFSPATCRRTCDNCKDSTKFAVRDVTQDSQQVVKMVMGIQNSKNTLLHAVDVFRGMGTQRVKQFGQNSVNGFGAGRSYTRTDAERLLHHLVINQVLDEKNEANGQGFYAAYLYVSFNFCLVIRVFANIFL